MPKFTNWNKKENPINAIVGWYNDNIPNHGRAEIYVAEAKDRHPTDYVINWHGFSKPDIKGDKSNYSNYSYLDTKSRAMEVARDFMREHPYAGIDFVRDENRSPMDYWELNQKPRNENSVKRWDHDQFAVELIETNHGTYQVVGLDGVSHEEWGEANTKELAQEIAEHMMSKLTKQNGELREDVPNFREDLPKKLQRADSSDYRVQGLMEESLEGGR